MVRLFDSHPGATVVAHLASTGAVEMSKRNRQPAVLDFVEEDVEQNGGCDIAELDMRITDDVQIVGEIERELVVGAAELRMNDIRSIHSSSRR